MNEAPHPDDHQIPLSRPGAHVACDLVFRVEDHVTMALQVAVADLGNGVADEELVVKVDDTPVEVREIPDGHGGRLHVVACGSGQLTVTYRASVEPLAETVVQPVDETDAVVALRQSRYCPSDALEPFARAELGHLMGAPNPPAAVAAWVFERLVYDLGSSGPLDTAVDTLLAGRGVCRDFAHLTVALCRAMGIPARLVSAYAPGLSPMDFHAVAEVAHQGRWVVHDATRLAPRPALVRIATGRDAADTAFSTSLSGSAELLSSSVLAVVDGDLPADDHRADIAVA